MDLLSLNVLVFPCSSRDALGHFPFVFSLYTPTYHYARVENEIFEGSLPRGIITWSTWSSLGNSGCMFTSGSSGRLSTDNRKTRENSFFFIVKRVSKFKASFHLI